MRLDGSGGLYVGTVGETSLHAIHVVRIAVAVERPFRIRYATGPWVRATSAIIPPDRLHALAADGGPLALFHRLPEADEAGGLTRFLSLAAPLSLDAMLERRLRGPLRRCFDRDEPLDGVAAMASEIFGRLPVRASGPRLDARVSRVLETLWRDDADIDLAELAGRAGLSPHRLTHLFRENTGTSMRHYRLWVRFRRSLARLGASVSLTDLAHEVGFADAAHFSRTFRRMLGVVPSDLQRSVRIVDVPPEQNGPRS